MPSDVHTTLLWFVALDPEVILIAPELEQVETTVPATAVGAAVIVSVLVEVVAAQFPIPLAVKVKVILPVSPAPGV